LLAPLEYSVVTTTLNMHFGEVEAPAAEVITSRKRSSVAAHRQARKKQAPGKAKTKAGSSRDSRPGSKQARVLALLGRAEGATNCCHHAHDPLAAALGARLLRWGGAQEALGLDLHSGKLDGGGPPMRRGGALRHPDHSAPRLGSRF